MGARGLAYHDNESYRLNSEKVRKTLLLIYSHTNKDKISTSRRNVLYNDESHNLMEENADDQ